MSFNAGSRTQENCFGGCPGPSGGQRRHHQLEHGRTRAISPRSSAPSTPSLTMNFPTVSQKPLASHSGSRATPGICGTRLATRDPDETRWEALDDDRVGSDLLGYPRRCRRILLKEARAGLDQLVADADQIGTDIERVSGLSSGPKARTTRPVEATVYGAVEWADKVATLAVDLDPNVVVRAGTAARSR
jgi:hypothetical protein